MTCKETRGLSWLREVALFNCLLDGLALLAPDALHGGSGEMRT